MSRANQFSDPTRGRGKLGHSVPRPILMLHKYCLYLQFHSYIPAVLPIQRMLSQVSRLMLCRGVFLQPWADRRLSSEMGKSGFVSLLFAVWLCMSHLAHGLDRQAELFTVSTSFTLFQQHLRPSQRKCYWSTSTSIKLVSTHIFRKYISYFPDNWWQRRQHCNGCMHQNT